MLLMEADNLKLKYMVMPALWYPVAKVVMLVVHWRALIQLPFLWKGTYYSSLKYILLTNACMSINFAIVQFWIDTHHFASLVAQLHVRQMSLYKYKKNILGSISGQRTGYLMFADNVTKCLLLIGINKECYLSIFCSMAFLLWILWLIAMPLLL